MRQQEAGCLVQASVLVGTAEAKLQRKHRRNGADYMQVNTRKEAALWSHSSFRHYAHGMHITDADCFLALFKPQSRIRAFLPKTKPMTLQCLIKAIKSRWMCRPLAAAARSPGRHPEQHRPLS